ncbi:MAG: hypothetical protein KatS3mg033_0092 [Thermonema sp.]|uniref:hypothetical protein n=1 Tax=Thermonema sp. TaxID=2231181 RepID=UPI0021DC96FB|nr:hypothetical protein [Thermonema sp.]GIV38292.1 MAG: hypothetical protein KatS3mg033_0092 [Thermonema sp.]
MKKLVVFLMPLVLLTSCKKEQGVSPTANFEKEIEFLKEMNISSLNLVVSSLGDAISRIDKDKVNLSQRRLIKETALGLNGRYFNADEKTIVNFLNNYGELILPGSFNKKYKDEYFIDLSTFDVYNERQLVLLQPFIDNIMNESDMNKVKSEAIAFQLSVINSTLSNNEKVQILSLTTCIISFVEFIEGGGIEKVQEILAEEMEAKPFSNGRNMGCSVNTRSVLAGAVVGFMQGAIGGCYAGAAGGTVTFPIVGTVTGCVSAGMVGGAIGFATGAVTGIITELITSCGR